MVKNFMEKIRQMFLWDSMEFHGKFHGIQWKSMEFSGIPWNFPCNFIDFHGIPWNFMKLRLMEFHGIQWNSVNSRNLMEFGFDREGTSSIILDSERTVFIMVCNL
jgi:hypothetical protein